MSDADITVGLATILVLGIGAQWIGRRVRIPSLLLLLPAGILAGGVFGLVEPEEMFGDLLFPLITLLLSLLLFQSGLQLDVRDLPAGGHRSVVRLVTVGLVITFLGGSLAAAAVLDIPAELAFLTGAILSVSGPTVVGPILDVVRPAEPIGSVLRWEGTTLDPLGATIGVIVLNLILRTGRGGFHPVLQMLARLGLGVVVGLLAAAFLVFVMSRFLLTDNMEASVALMFAVAAFASTEVLLSEAGLFATTAMGIAVANQRIVRTDRIAGFGETLDVLIIAVLFMVLGALITIDDLVDYLIPSLVISLVLILVVRPAAVALSFVRMPLRRNERAFAGWMDPRGIVAAATAAQFAASLTSEGYDTRFMLPVVFGVIVATGLVYATTAKPVAHLLDVARPPANGVALIGDDPWLESFGVCLASTGVPTILVADRGDVGSVTDRTSADGEALILVSSTGDADDVEEALDSIDVATAIISFRPGVAHSLLVADLIERFGRRNVLLLPEERPTLTGFVADRWTPRPFGGEITRSEIDRLLAEGHRVAALDAATPMSPAAVPLAVVRGDRTILRDPGDVELLPDDVLIAVTIIPST